MVSNILKYLTEYINYLIGFQLCFGQPLDTEILTLLRSKVGEVAEAVQIWMLKKKQVLKLFHLGRPPCIVIWVFYPSVHFLLQEEKK